MAKNKKRSGGDTTIDSSPPDEGAELDDELEPETQIEGQRDEMPPGEPVPPGEPQAAPIIEGFSSNDYFKGEGAPPPSVTESASGAPVLGATPGAPPAVTPTESASGAPMPPERTLQQMQSDEFAEDVKRGRLRSYVMDKGLLTPGQVENASDEELEALYAKSIGLQEKPAMAPSTLLEQTPAQEAQLALTSSSRDEKIRLLVRYGGISHAQAETLTTEELNLQVRSIVLSAISTEAQQREQAAYQVQPLSDAPYGGDPPRYYVVTKGQKYAHDGQVIEVKPGETVNDRSHDVEQLRRFGIVLHEIVAPDPSSPL